MIRYSGRRATTWSNHAVEAPKPCSSRSAGPSTAPSARTCRSTPSTDTTVPAPPVAGSALVRPVRPPIRLPTRHPPGDVVFLVATRFSSDGCVDDVGRNGYGPWGSVSLADPDQPLAVAGRPWLAVVTQRCRVVTQWSWTGDPAGGPGRSRSCRLERCSKNLQPGEACIGRLGEFLGRSVRLGWRVLRAPPVGSRRVRRWRRGAR
jgi:hypothetical protein